ncbi:YihY/virulence factor BrkB family protein [Alteromonas sp. ASW11-130]|uniref:YihY/virulence factor BrkB family protein n=1 Tax=Alteromonas sp. ASW11-130 TaxID=3015775 RepID=UPI002242C414|nr:YihY/virulence factor BrkB family protein [Alteromonas sp. ASW11-130]MCW8092348.1 YihY/virulence factor BrkB family protein [Alteromonas sp. ASW11-130]
MGKNKSGTNAQSAAEFSISAWWRIGKRTYFKMQKDNLPLIAAGVGFYFLLAIFPFLAGVISLYGLIVTPEQLSAHMTFLINFLPQESRYILQEQLEHLISNTSGALGTGVIVSFMLTIWSSSKGANALITACNITYSESEGRSFLGSIIARLVLTVAIIVAVIVALIFITVLPKLITIVSGYKLSDSVANWITWPILLVMFNTGLAALYRYSPHRANAKWRWVTPGSTVATIFWIIFSFAFSYYLREFASYNKTYGSVGGIIILLMWFYLSAYIILLGAEFNSAMEYQTEKDSTTGEAEPKGERGAYVADHSPNDSEAPPSEDNKIQKAQ